MKKYFTFLFIVNSFIGLAQTTLIIYPDKDNTIYQESPNNSNALGSNIFAGNTNNGIGYARRALLHFSLTGIPSGATITSASLKLYCNQTNSGSVIVALNKLISDWGNGSSIGSGTQATGASATTNDPTWNSNFYNTSTWSTSGGDINTLASDSISVSSSSQYYIWDANQLKSDVQDWLNSPTTNYGWMLIGDESTNQTAKRFASVEDLTISNRPQLTVVYTTSLPIKLISFNSAVVTNGILLNWEIAAKKEITSFIIDHSLNGTDFNELAVINTNESQKTNYVYLHSTNEIGKHYYRLNIKENSGEIIYSPIITEEISNQINDVVLANNPVRDKLILQNTNKISNNKYSIVNDLGQVVISGYLQGNEIGVSQLLSGIYYLQFNNGNLLLSLKFLKE